MLLFGKKYITKKANKFITKNYYLKKIKKFIFLSEIRRNTGENDTDKNKWGNSKIWSPKR